MAYKTDTYDSRREGNRKEATRDFEKIQLELLYSQDVKN